MADIISGMVWKLQEAGQEVTAKAIAECIDEYYEIALASSHKSPAA